MRGFLKSLTVLMLAGLPLAATAQDLAGRDTASNWRVTHQERFGIWNSICDERPESEGLKQRCYIRWVDVYAGRPQFGALFVFVTPDAKGHAVEFGVEPGTVFLRDGFQVTGADDVLWQMRDPACLRNADCSLDSEQMGRVLAAMQSGDHLQFRFIDRFDRDITRTWDLSGFARALEDFETQSKARGLI